MSNNRLAPSLWGWCPLWKILDPPLLSEQDHKLVVKFIKHREPSRDRTHAAILLSLLQMESIVVRIISLLMVCLFTNHNNNESD